MLAGSESFGPFHRRLAAFALLLVVAGGAVSAPADRPTTSSVPGTERTAAGADRVEAKPLRVVLFYSPSCPGCKKVEQALKTSAKRWGRRIRIERRKLQTAEVFREMFRYEKHYGSKGDESIKLFVGGRCLAGSKAVAARLNDAVAAELAAGSATFVPPPPGQDGGAGGEGQLFAEILSRFQGFSAGAVAVAGLLDGVNPCAFTTIIFLLSMLAYLGKSRRQLAAVGVGFTAAVFVTYFVLGLGLLGAVKTFAFSRGISTGLAYAVAALAFALAGWSLIDVIRYARTGDVKKMTLGLPKAVKARIRSVIRVGLSTRVYFGLAPVPVLSVSRSSGTCPVRVATAPAVRRCVHHAVSGASRAMSEWIVLTTVPASWRPGRACGRGRKRPRCPISASGRDRAGLAFLGCFSRFFLDRRDQWYN